MGQLGIIVVYVVALGALMYFFAIILSGRNGIPELESERPLTRSG